MGGFSSLSVTVIALAIGVLGCKKSQAAPSSRRELFVTACARCHDAEGGGGLPAYAGGPAPRNFRDHEFQLSRTDEQLKQAIRKGKGAGMPPFGSTFDDTELDMLVTQIRSFDPERK